MKVLSLCGVRLTTRPANLKVCLSDLMRTSRRIDSPSFRSLGSLRTSPPEAVDDLGPLGDADPAEGALAIVVDLPDL